MPAASVILATAGYDHTIRFWEAPVCTCYRTVQYADSVSNSSPPMDFLTMCFPTLRSK
jgi:hypothetical protein